MSTYGHGPTSREQMIIDLREGGAEIKTIAQAMNLSETYVQQVVTELFAPRLDDWQSAAWIGSECLLVALRRHHPERFGPERFWGVA